MWNDRPPGPPVEEGENLATIPRGPAEQLRVTLATYNGHPYLSVRVWTLGHDGGWWPAKGKGVSIRIREIVPVGRALAEALRLTGQGLPPRAALEGPRPDPEQARYVERRRQPPPRQGYGGQGPPSQGWGHGDDFDEL